MSKQGMIIMLEPSPWNQTHSHTHQANCLLHDIGAGLLQSIRTLMDYMQIDGFTLWTFQGLQEALVFPSHQTQRLLRANMWN